LAAEIDESKLPPPATNRIDFARDIKPIFESSCFRCHGVERPKSKYSLATRESALKGGENGVDILPGQSAKSPLIHYVSGLAEDIEMPPKGKGDPLTSEQIGLLRAWIDQGVQWSAPEPPPEPQLTMSPTIRWISVSGDAAKFREHFWMRDGWSGGVEHFELKDQTTNGWSTLMEGRLLTDDYKVSLAITKNDVGFAHLGFERYRKYFDDTGGYYEKFSPSTYDLNRDLNLDIGRFWVDLGLTLPNWPRMVLGYEYQYKDGDKSTLQWGRVAQTGTTRNIFPAYKDLNDQTHLIKFDLDHEIKGVRIEDNFRGEFYDLSTRRNNSYIYPDFYQAVQENHQHFQGANTLRLEKQFTDWLFTSGGYLYSHLSADAFVIQQTGRVDSPVPFQNESAQVTLERESHVFNLNGLLGPWDGLTLSAGVQSEWTRQTGFGDGLISEATNHFRSDLDKASVQENVLLRYSKIPFTTLFAEARLQQESIGQFEEQMQAGGGGFQDFLRDTDASSELKDFRLGFNTSPWQRVSLSAHYFWRDSQSDYDHKKDFATFFDDQGNPTLGPGDGYSAFIRSRDLQTDGIEAKLVVRPASWLKTTLKYQLAATDYHTTTDPASGFDPLTGTVIPGGASPGGKVFAGNYDANTYSVNATLTPFGRLTFSSTFSYQQSRTATQHQPATSVVDYRGDTFSLWSSATYAVDQATDIFAGYSFSHADYGQTNVNEGLPVGMIYQLHSLQAGVRRKFSERLTASLQYAFYQYDEPSSGHVNDYTAHGIFATVTMRWP